LPQLIAAKVKSVLGIASPSKVFAAIGEQMGEGIDVGFIGSMRQVARDMANAIPTDFNTNVNVRSGYTASAAGGHSGYAGGTIINQNLSITTPRALSERELAREFKNMSQRLALSL
jgi:hypothetical protein